MRTLPEHSEVPVQILEKEYLDEIQDYSILERCMWPRNSLGGADQFHSEVVCGVSSLFREVLRYLTDV